MQKSPKIKLSLVISSVTIFIVLFFYREQHNLFRERIITPDFYSDKEDTLPSAENPNFTPKTKSIFFHETSYRGGLTPRQACAVEAAARAHPEWQVYVLFSSPVTHQELRKSCLADLRQFNNVKFARVQIAEYSRGTMVQPIVKDLKKSKYPVQHSADILKILTLNKWGGIYLDTDMIVVKSLESLPPNWIVKQNKKFTESGILAFAKDEFGHNVTSSILKEIFESYDPNDWSVCGRRAIQKVVKRLCPDFINADTCKGLTLFPSELFYPLHYTLWKLYFETGSITKFESPYSFHMWNYLSINRSIIKHTPYEMLARKYCPKIFGTYGDEFGV